MLMLSLLIGRCSRVRRQHRDSGWLIEMGAVYDILGAPSLRASLLMVGALRLWQSYGFR
jgi:hypothetical protein